MIITLITVTFDDDSINSWIVKRFDSQNPPGWTVFIDDENKRIAINESKIKFYKIEQLEKE